MYRGLIYVGRRGIALHAISGIDIALWDIKGKALGKPVCELLGTPQRDRVRAYASMLMPDDARGGRGSASASSATTASRRSSSAGARSARTPTHDVALAAAAVEAAGDGVEILIDAGLGYVADAADARSAVARELEELGVYWLEEPFEPDEYEAYAELADTVDIRVAAGEQDATRWGFRELIERGHVDLVQPDVTRCGGITEMLRIAELAREHGVATVPHAWKSGIIKAASLHVNAVLPGRALPGVLRRGDADQHDADAASGCRSRPTASSPSRPRPGSASTLDEDVIARYRVDRDEHGGHMAVTDAHRARRPRRAPSSPAASTAASAASRARGARHRRDERRHVHRRRRPRLHRLPRRLRPAAPRPQRPRRRRGVAATRAPSG